MLKKYFLGMILIFSTLLIAEAKPPTDAELVTQAVTLFASSADARDIEGIETVLHPSFRAVVHRAFGKENTTILPKETYLELLSAGKIGGDERQVAIHMLHIQGNTAFVQAEFTGQSSIFKTHLQLLKNKNGQWQIVADIPTIIALSKE